MTAEVAVEITTGGATTIHSLPLRPSLDDGSPEASIARFLDRSTAHLTRATDRVVRATVPRLLEALRQTLRRELDITPAQWERLSVELEHELVTAVATALSAAAAGVRPRLAMDAVTTLIPRMKKGTS